MPRPRQIDPSAIALRLQTQGPQSAQDLATHLRVDDSNVRRALRLPEIELHLIRLGSRRGTTYALRRSVRALGHTFPIRRVGADGRARDWAEITSLHGGWRIQWADTASAPAWADQLLTLGGFNEGFPFFLSEARPQGFLGRAVARALPPALGLGPDPRQWPGDDDTLVYLSSEGDDLPGDLIVGDIPLRRFQQTLLSPPAALADADRATRYPEIAAAAAALGTAGSSVEGEQPKFLVTLAERGPSIVKFTDLLSSPTGRRWADLLAAEARAQTILHAHGQAESAPRLLDAGGRRFIETPRYDRVGTHGRRGVVSLRALHDAFEGPEANDWPTIAAHLHERGLIDADALRATRLRHAFGRLIGNSDMHLGNLAFWFDDALPFRVAPAYDMLPMQWAPTLATATPSPELTPPLPLPAERDIWHEAAGWADELWRGVADDPLVSADFAAIARAAATTLARLRAVA